MNKNNIILIGIVLLFLLVIRPKKSKNEVSETAETFTSESDVEHGGAGGSFGTDVEAVPLSYTNYENSSYVQTSLDNASNTVDESLNLQGQTYTV